MTSQHESKFINPTILCCMTVGFVFVLFLSIGSSPFYRGESIVFDASVFQSMGWLWAKGYPPYICSWDQKGPIIFGINALGYLIGGGDGNHTMGVLLLEGIAIGLFFYIVFRTFQLHFSDHKAIVFTCMTVVILAGSYAGGANTEGFTLPIWATILYSTSSWLNNFEKGNLYLNPWYGFLSGCLLSFAFLTRLTNAAGACGIMAAICIMLALKGEWKNVFENAGTFILGFLALTLPFLAYFYAMGALDEMLFGTIGFNVLYATEPLHQPIVKYLSHILSGFPAYALVSSSVLLFLVDKEKRPRAFVWFMATFMMILWWFPSRKFLKYIILGVPFFPILITELDRLKGRFPHWICTIAIALCCLIPMENLRFIHTFRDPAIKPLTERLEKTIPQEERNIFMAYEVTPQIYMNLNAIPCYRFHMGQEHFSAESEMVKEEVHELFLSKKAKWILVKGEPTVIEDILETAYIVAEDYADIGTYKLYKRL